MKILIAEDDMVSRNFLNRFLGKYGDCDLVVDGLEALDAFLMALKDKEPYDLICLDIMMPKADGVKTLKAIRDLEKQYGMENRAKIIMTTALAEAQLVRKVFDYGCEAYATKPIDTKKLVEVMEKLGLISNKAKDEPELPIITNHDIKKISAPVKSEQGDRSNSGNEAEGYFKSVQALEGYKLEVVMNTGTTIHFDFSVKLETSRFARLRDEEQFKNVRTDGNYLIFEKAGKIPLKITASEFMDLVLIDRQKQK